MYYVRTMEQRVNESLARQRFSMLLLGVFASVALVLATIGIYGVMAYLVNQGTRELGIRIALGASPRNILRLVVRQGMVLAFSGVAIGLVAAFLLVRLMRSMLFGVEVTDPSPSLEFPCCWRSLRCLRVTSRRSVPLASTP